MDPWRILQHKGRYTKCNDRSSQISWRGVFTLLGSLSVVLLLCSVFSKKKIFKTSGKMQQGFHM